MEPRHGGKKEALTMTNELKTLGEEITRVKSKVDAVNTTLAEAVQPIANALEKIAAA